MTEKCVVCGAADHNCSGNAAPVSESSIITAGGVVNRPLQLPRLKSRFGRVGYIGEERIEQYEPSIKGVTLVNAAREQTNVVEQEDDGNLDGHNHPAIATKKNSGETYMIYRPRSCDGCAALDVNPNAALDELQSDDAGTSDDAASASSDELTDTSDDAQS